MNEPIKLVTARDVHTEQVIQLLETLLEDARNGEIVAFSGVAEYKTGYRDVITGCMNKYSMVGALTVAAHRVAAS